MTTKLRIYPTAATLKYLCITGIKNAAVFPDPVIELATTSFPVDITGMANCWIGVGRAYPSYPTAFKIGLIKRNSSKDFYLVFWSRVRIAFLLFFLGLSVYLTIIFSSKIGAYSSGSIYLLFPLI